jgi:hypothetical protein
MLGREGFGQDLDLSLLGKKHVDDHIGEKRDDAFPGATGAELTLIAREVADMTEISLKKKVHLPAKFEVIAAERPQSFFLTVRNRTEMQPHLRKRFELFGRIVAHEPFETLELRTVSALSP